MKEAQQCKYCHSQNLLQIELLKEIGYHIGESEYHQDDFYLCLDCGKITCVKRKET